MDFPFIDELEKALAKQISDLNKMFSRPLEELVNEESYDSMPATSLVWVKGTDEDFFTLITYCMQPLSVASARERARKHPRVCLFVASIPGYPDPDRLFKFMCTFRLVASRKIPQA